MLRADSGDDAGGDNSVDVDIREKWLHWQCGRDKLSFAVARYWERP